MLPFRVEIPEADLDDLHFAALEERDQCVEDLQAFGRQSKKP